jgi:hypothetical protein
VSVKDIKELAEKSREEVMAFCFKQRKKAVANKFKELTASYNFWRKWCFLFRFSDSEPPTEADAAKEVDDHCCTLVERWTWHGGSSRSKYVTALSILDLCEISIDDTLEISRSDLDNLKGRG